MRYVEDLTGEEHAILLGLADGRSLTDIAVELLQPLGRVRSHRQDLFDKLDADNDAHAVALGYHYGLLTPAVRA